MAETKISKYKYQIEFETFEENVQGIVEVITETLRINLSGSLISIPKITFSTYEKEEKVEETK